MMILFCLSFITFVKVISAQTYPYAITGTNGITNAGVNLPTITGANGPITGHGMQSANTPLSNGFIQSPTNMAAGSFMSYPNLANTLTNANIVNGKLAEQGVSGGPVYSNAATTNLPAATANINAVKTANAILTAENAASNLAYDNVLAKTEDLKQLNSLTPVLNGNMATFYLGNDGNTFTVTSGSPGTQGIGVQVMADALEVGGTVAVNGRIPIYGMVGINGNIPTDGMASVSYSCANPSTLL